MPRDWRSSIGRRKLKNHLLNRVTDGSVILLHDSGETFGADRDAPSYMLSALTETLGTFEERSLQCVRIDEMTGSAKRGTAESGVGRRMLYTVWMLWERCFIKLFHVVPVDPDNTFLQVRIREYTGSTPITFLDGEEIRKGDQIVELHLNNDMLFHLGKESRSAMHLAIQLIRRTEQLLPQILRLMETDPSYKNAKGLYGISLIHRGPEQLGFTILDLPKGVFSRITQWYLRVLMYVIHPQGKKRLKTKSELLVPKIIAISKKELMNRYIA
ncbi:hypothetical protein N6H14_03870 [Paenibacillus sp. CC-CFT747]|nr:hypothetical protein N6H14_03870 [Paenibacillus sp. CC-CFT747]